MSIQSKRFDELERHLSVHSDISQIKHTEDYISPHKSAAFVPYDCVIYFEKTVDEEIVENILKEEGLKFDSICGVDSEAGQCLAFVSLA